MIRYFTKRVKTGELALMNKAKETPNNRIDLVAMINSDLGLCLKEEDLFFSYIGMDPKFMCDTKYLVYFGNFSETQTFGVVGMIDKPVGTSYGIYNV